MKIRRIKTAILSAMVFVGCGFGAMKVNATGTSANWSVTYNPNYSTNCIVSIMQRKTAKASCTSASHSSANAPHGYSYVSCMNYTMTKKTITDTGSVIVYPNVGNPTQDIKVTYKFTSYSPTPNDTFCSSGRVFKK